MTTPPATTDGPSDLLQRARGVLLRAMNFYRGDARTAGWLRERLERLDQPLRIAVTGRVKSGKSTLINALAGEELAPADAEERTQVNTLYRYGSEPKIAVHTPHGTVQNIPVTSIDIGTIRNLQHWRPDEVARVVVDAPSPGLQACSFVETPGLASSTVKETDRAALAEILSDADAVLYLTRHPNQTDIQFLQSVHELGLARYAPISTILVLSRADEIGNGGTEALGHADQLAQQYQQDPSVRSYTQHVLPVVGLLGQSAMTLSSEDVATLGALTQLGNNTLAALLLSADRFAHSPAPESVPAASRERLLTRFGRFGVEVALSAIQQGASDAGQLRSTLWENSRMTNLQDAVRQQFIERRDALRARAALLAVDMVLRANPRPGVQQLRGEFERLLANTHEWKEMRLLSALRAGQVHFPRPMRIEAERLLGAFGDDPHSRLGQDVQVPDAELANQATDALARWREHLVNPMHDRPHRDAVRTVLRSCERLMARQAKN
jgi:hypothetical protein